MFNIQTIRGIIILPCIGFAIIGKPCQAAGTEDNQPVDWVDPFVGTSTSRWMLYSGPSMPFGMVKLSPDNQQYQWKAGYEYTITALPFLSAKSALFEGLSFRVQRPRSSTTNAC